MALLNKLGNYRNFGLLIIRVGLGLMFIFHGYPKLLGGQKEWEQTGSAMGYVGIHFLPTVWGLLAALTETVGGVLLILGLGFRLVCLLMVINLLVAIEFHLHQSGEMGGLMGASHAIEDCIMFAGLLFVGPGKYSVDKK
ncbi:DoxX family protein [Mucilaginibacter xinganensis]|uniref:DoxX family protein n=1 Tax=Mucilaginibacter xinganensis TaxID=1234841 RepID=A0A223NRL4_9SPHI|nr:DoxX family protein [Mucilaginibacter xinganensis]ASU32549.1 DoxX family protein [Mucilaginibacter xinganensis]